MRRCGARAVILCFLSLVLSHEALAQRARKPRRKPFASMNASAHRLRDSLRVRLSASSTIDLFAASPLTSSAPTLSDSVLRDSIISVARSQIGTKYRLGAQLPGKAFDCSGLIRYVMGMLRFDLPRTAHEQSKFGREVARDTSSLRPGDLLTFGTSRHVTHIGIYAGNGRLIHASTSKRQVIETSMTSLGPSMLKKWQSARRLIVMADSVPAADADRP